MSHSETKLILDDVRKQQKDISHLLETSLHHTTLLTKQIDQSEKHLNNLDVLSQSFLKIVEGVQQCASAVEKLAALYESLGKRVDKIESKLPVTDQRDIKRLAIEGLKNYRETH